MKKKLTLIIALVICMGYSYSTVRSVPGTYPTIQAAINAAMNGDTVLVDPGTYTENINFRGKNIVVTSKFFQTGSLTTVWSTIINGSNPANSDTGSCVIFSNHEDSSCVLQGFNITGGHGTRWQDEHGAGRYREGGGILVAFSYPIIQFNIIHDNSCQITNDSVVSNGGGGLRIGDSYVKLLNNVIFQNSGKYGAGVVFNYAGCLMKNNVICTNYGASAYYGGSVWVNGSNSRMKIFENNTITGNSATGNGTTAGIAIFSGIINSVKNCILWGNTSPGNLQIIGTPQYVYYSDVQGGVSGTGNINLNPMFADSNYYLSTGSPCIDAGDSTAVYNDPADPVNPSLAKLPAKGTLRNDIGAYGGPLSTYLSNLLIGIHQVSSQVPSGFSLSQNYPNPFNPETNISYQIFVYGNVTMKLFDVTGRELKVLVNSMHVPGTYLLTFDASAYPSGVYFYRLEASKFIETKKMILVK